MGADDGAGGESLAAALDELIVAASALVVDLGRRGGLLEQGIAAQLSTALVALASARGGLAPERGAGPDGPQPFPLQAPCGDRS